MKKDKPQSQGILIKVIILLFVIFMCSLIFIKIRNDNDPNRIIEKQRSEIFSNIDKTNTANITKFYTYGTHFNIEGTLDIVKISGIQINFVDLILKDLNGEEIAIKADFNYLDNTLAFSTSSEINSGIDLETLAINDYYILLKATYSNSDVKYYSLSNSSEYEDINYYTISKENHHNKINIYFDTYNETKYMAINVKEENNLPEDVYDIAIDPGHGGKDKGSTNGDYKEADITLDYAKKLKTELENLGLKVFMSRDGTEASNADMANNMYDDDGRINILNASKAKMLLSLHIDNDKYNKEKGGIEVYAPNNCNLEFASNLAKNLVENSGSYYSGLNSFKKAEGVYVRNYTNLDILAFNSRANKNGYEPYNVTTSTPYLYIIRETGGIATGAFVDGRNKSYGTNKYYNSNYGIEAYSIQLGYMGIQSDLDNIISKPDSYIAGIVKTVQEYYNL